MERKQPIEQSDACGDIAVAFGFPPCEHGPYDVYEPGTVVYRPATPEEQLQGFGGGMAEEVR